MHFNINKIKKIIGILMATNQIMNISKDGAKLIKLVIEPNGWQGYGIYEPIFFTVVPVWNDGISDLDCRRAGDLPEWTVSDYGYIEGIRMDGAIDSNLVSCGPRDKKIQGRAESKEDKGKIIRYGSVLIKLEETRGRTILYRSGHGGGIGKVTVSYGGLSTSVVVKGSEEVGSTLPQDYLYLVDLEKVSTHEQSDEQEVVIDLKEVNNQAKKFTNNLKHEKIRREAHALSEKLEKYIRDWMDGKVPARLPRGLLPAGIDNYKSKDWTLCNIEEITPEEQWGIRPAHSVETDYSKLYFFSPEPNCTYSLIIFTAPFGSKLVFEGEFPHCRFMSIQVSPPFDSKYPLTGGIGAAEVPIVDVDIEPLPGNVNPFRLNADRKATKRSYQVEFEMGEGNAVELNPTLMVPPNYRAPSSTRRIAGPFNFSGFIGDGKFLPAIVWMRYYAPDNGFGPLGGVRLPKAHFELSTGEKFWLKCDSSLGFLRANTVVPGFRTAPLEPPKAWGPSLGWLKMYGLHLIYVEGMAIQAIPEDSSSLVQSVARKRVRNYDKYMWNRGPVAPPPGNFESSCTCCPYISYLTRRAMLGHGKVYVMTGKLPKTPKTLNGNPVFTGGEARYWSISRCHESPDYIFPAINYGTLNDEELILDSENHYIICYSRKEDRPKNANAENGITWQAWGPDATNYLTIRWMSVSPDHILPEHVPNEINVPWKVGAWSQKEFDKTILSQNQPGLLGPYHPILHYMIKEEFEALGNEITPKKFPKWTV